MSDPAPERKSLRQMSDEEIVQAFDQLVEAWLAREDAMERREAFDHDYRPPEQPALTIESTEALIEYNRQKWRYEQKREVIENRYTEHDATYSAAAHVVGTLLPAAHTLLHTYRGDHPDLQDGEYTIEHGVTEAPQGVRGQPQPPRIIVRSLRSRRTRPSS